MPRSRFSSRCIDRRSFRFVASLVTETRASCTLFDIRSCIFQTSVDASRRVASVDRSNVGQRRWRVRRPVPSPPLTRDRFRETFLLVSVLTFVQLLQHFCHFVRTYVVCISVFAEIIPAILSRVAQHSASLSHVNGEFNDEATIGRDDQGDDDRRATPTDEIVSIIKSPRNEMSFGEGRERQTEEMKISSRE